VFINLYSPLFFFFFFTRMKPMFLDRMPTVSAAQALQELRSPEKKAISTGLKGLDAMLLHRDTINGGIEEVAGGIERGVVTEVYGPPGVGKTTFG
jgi:RecA/RadA recombinase